MSRVSYFYDGEEITVSFTATTVSSDYGVEGSPVFYELEDVEVNNLTILGVDVAIESLPKELREEILALAPELVDGWEICDD